jgi:Domain of unknown function (DUF4357)
MPSTSIRLFLADGSADGLWVVEKSNWTGVALVIPRATYTRVRSQRDEMTRAGIYVLVGPSETKPDYDRIYVGEAEILRHRLDSHHANKDFWTRVVLFTKKDGSLNKAHVKYLEARLVSLAHQAERVEVENGNAPQQPALSEAERADTEAFLDDMRLIYPVLGVRAFERPESAEVDTAQLSLSGPGASGGGREASDGFVVDAGSIARPETVPSIHAYLADLRETLQQEGVLVSSSEGLRFTRDYVFNSPSTAAGVLLGRAANGRTEWRDESGRTLKELQARQVASAT